MNPLTLFLMINAGAGVMCFVTDPNFWLLHRVTGDEGKRVFTYYTLPQMIFGFITRGIALGIQWFFPTKQTISIQKSYSDFSSLSSLPQQALSFGTIFGPQQQHSESFLPKIRSMRLFFSAMIRYVPRNLKILLNCLIQNFIHLR